MTGKWHSLLVLLSRSSILHFFCTWYSTWTSLLHGIHLPAWWQMTVCTILVLIPFLNFFMFSFYKLIFYSKELKKLIWASDYLFFWLPRCSQRQPQILPPSRILSFLALLGIDWLLKWIHFCTLMFACFFPGRFPAL